MFELCEIGDRLHVGLVNGRVRGRIMNIHLSGEAVELLRLNNHLIVINARHVVYFRNLDRETEQGNESTDFTVVNPRRELLRESTRDLTHYSYPPFPSPFSAPPLWTRMSLPPPFAEFPEAEQPSRREVEAEPPVEKKVKKKKIGWGWK